MGNFSERGHVPAYGTITAQPEGWHGDNMITRDDGRTVMIGRKWLIKVPC